MENEVLAPAQIVEEEGPTLTPGTVLKVKVAAEEVAAGVQVPDTTHLYWKVFMVLEAEVRLMVAVVTLPYKALLDRFAQLLPVFSCH